MKAPMKPGRKKKWEWAIRHVSPPETPEPSCQDGKMSKNSWGRKKVGQMVCEASGNAKKKK
jgi:hypothetical protein